MPNHVEDLEVYEDVVEVLLVLDIFLNITIVQAYAPTSDNDDNEIEKLYDQLQNVINQASKKDITRRLECKRGQGCP